MMERIVDRESARVWQEKYDNKAPKAGDKAPDFLLSDNEGLNPVRLSAFRGQKPVVLIFGSFT